VSGLTVGIRTRELDAEAVAGVVAVAEASTSLLLPLATRDVSGYPAFAFSGSRGGGGDALGSCSCSGWRSRNGVTQTPSIEPTKSTVCISRARACAFRRRRIHHRARTRRRRPTTPPTTPPTIGAIDPGEESAEEDGPVLVLGVEEVAVADVSTVEERLAEVGVSGVEKGLADVDVLDEAGAWLDELD